MPVVGSRRARFAPFVVLSPVVLHSHGVSGVAQFSLMTAVTYK